MPNALSRVLMERRNISEERMPGLLDLDPSQMQVLPDDERKRLMLGNILLGISAGAFNSNKNNQWGALGSGLLQGAHLGQQAVSDAVRQRGAGITQALQAAKLQEEIASQRRYNEWMGGGSQPSQLPQLPAQSGAFPPPGPAAGRFGPESDPTYQPSAPPTSSAPPSAPTATRTGNRTADYFLSEARKLGIEQAVFAALMSDQGKGEGIRAAAKMVADAQRPQAVSAGQTMWSPDRGVHFVAPNIDRGQTFDGGRVSTLPGYVLAAE